MSQSSAVLRILIISEMSTPYTVGGGEARYALLAHQLVKLGHQVEWLSMHQRDSPAFETIHGVTHRHLGPRLTTPPVRSLIDKLRFMGQVVLHLLRHRYDIVDCQTYAPLPAAWLACKLRKNPLVATIHDTSSPDTASDQWLSDFDRRLAVLVERRLYKLGYDHVVTVSEAVRDVLVHRFKLASERVSAVPNGVDIARLALVQPHPVPVDLLFVGRLVPHKHPSDVLEVLSRLNGLRSDRGLPPFKARFVGDGPLLAALQNRAQMLGVAAHCHFCGDLPAHDDVIAHIRSARVLLLPSTREGFGLVLAEAMAVGTAIVAYDLPAVRQTVGHALAHQLAPVLDVEAMAHITEGLLEDDQRRAKSALLGHQHVSTNLDLPRFTRQVLEIYRQTIAKTRGSPRR